MSECPCGRADRHVHSDTGQRGRAIEYLRLEAQGICPDGGMPFELCIAICCDCFLTTEAIPAYIESVTHDLAAIEGKRNDNDSDRQR